MAVPSPPIERAGCAPWASSRLSPRRIGSTRCQRCCGCGGESNGNNELREVYTYAPHLTEGNVVMLDDVPGDGIEGEADEEDFRLGAVGIRDNSQTSHKSMAMTPAVCRQMCLLASRTPFDGHLALPHLSQQAPLPIQHLRRTNTHRLNVATPQKQPERVPAEELEAVRVPNRLAVARDLAFPSGPLT